MKILMFSLVVLGILGLFWHSVEEESVLIIKDFGIQLQLKYWTGNEETKVVAIRLLIKFLMY